MPVSHIYLYSLSHIERLQLQLPLAVSRLSIIVTCSESQNLSHLKTYLAHRTFKNLPILLKTQDDCCPIYIQDMEKFIGEFRYGKNLDTGWTPYASSGYKR